MSKIIKENEVSLAVLADHLEDSGWCVEINQNRLVLHTERGLGFSIFLDTERQFVTFSTSLPVKNDFTDTLELVNTLNNEVFLGCFSLDDDNDLIVTYQMIYERGLIFAQFARIVRRFAGLLEHVVDHFDQEDSIFNFSSGESMRIESAPNSLQ